MIAGLAGYFLSIVAAAMLVAIAMKLLHDGHIQKIVALAGGCLILICALTPLIRLDFDSISLDFSGYLSNQSAELAQMQAESDAEVCRIIIETTQAYILDKAEQIGAVISVEVTPERAEGGYYYPAMVSVTGVTTASQKRELSAYLRDVLGIPESKQIWRTV